MLSYTTQLNVQENVILSFRLVRGDFMRIMRNYTGKRTNDTACGAATAEN